MEPAREPWFGVRDVALPTAFGERFVVEREESFKVVTSKSGNLKHDVVLRAVDCDAPAGVGAIRLLRSNSRRFDYGRNNRLIFTMKARLARAGKRRASVSRSSLNTTNSSLPGRYSHRSRTFALTSWLLELYCSSALVNICVVIV